MNRVWLEGDSVPTAMSLSPEFCGFSVDWSMLPLRWVEFLDIFLSFVDATHKNSVDFRGLVNATLKMRGFSEVCRGNP